MVKLAVNLDGVQALRRFFGGEDPDLTEIAHAAVKAGVKAVAMSLTHPDADQETAIAELKKNVKVPLLVEAEPDGETLKSLLKLAPRMVSLTTRKPQYRTSHGGLNLDGNSGKDIAKAVETLKKKGIKVSLSLDPDAGVIRKGKRLNIDAVHLSTFRYAAAAKAKREEIAEDLHVAGLLVRELGLESHAGGGLNYGNLAKVAEIPHLAVLIMGAPLVARSVETGIHAAVEEARDIIEEVCAVSSAI